MKLHLSKSTRYIRDSEVRRLLVAPSIGSAYDVRIAVETESEVIVFDHATVGNMLRASAWVLYHPKCRGVELKAQRLGEYERKKGYAEDQLLETGRSDVEIQGELDQLIRAASSGTS
jgi:hypothetical protein